MLSLVLFCFVVLFYTCDICCSFCFFFFKQKTAYEMRISDWSSDVCSSDLGVTTSAPADAEWWRLYKDPVLDGLVADALAANTDVRVAVARIARARAALREVRGDRLPSTDLSAGATYGRVSESQTLPGADREGWQVDGGLTVGYEVDLFGRVSRDRKSTRGDLAAAQRSEEHTSELQSLMRISYAVFCLQKKKNTKTRR